MSLLGKWKGGSCHRHLREGGDPLLLWIPAFEAVAKPHRSVILRVTDLRSFHPISQRLG